MSKQLEDALGDQAGPVANAAYRYGAYLRANPRASRRDLGKVLRDICDIFGVLPRIDDVRSLGETAHRAALAREKDGPRFFELAKQLADRLTAERAA